MPARRRCISASPRPPTAWPCFYGVDTPEREKLLAATMSEDEMRDHLGVDSLRFISLDGLYRAVGEAGGFSRPPAPQYCDACFSGRRLPGVHRAPIQHRLVEAERAGGVDHADKVHGAALPCVGAICGTQRSNALTLHQMGPRRPLSSAIAPNRKAPRPFPGTAP
jgi:hypothetical protein